MTPVRMVMEMNNIDYKLVDNFEEASQTRVTFNG